MKKILCKRITETYFGFLALTWRIEKYLSTLEVHRKASLHKNIENSKNKNARERGRTSDLVVNSHTL